MTSAEKLSTGPSRTRARGLDVDGNINIPGNSLSPTFLIIGKLEKVSDGTCGLSASFGNIAA